MRVAIVHEMLIKSWGAEQVVLDILNLYPDADVFTLMYDEKKLSPFFWNRPIHTAKITQYIYKLTKKPRVALPFMRRAVESLDLSGYDLVISSSSGFAHGCITDPQTLHICYYHSPARYLWDATHEVQDQLKSKLPTTQPNKKIQHISLLHKLFVGHLFSRLRVWDIWASRRPDVIIANAHEVKNRIEKYYRRTDASIMYPGVRVQDFSPTDMPPKDREYYLTGWALTPFKLHDKTIQLFNRNKKKLVVFGSGDQENYLRSIAHENIEFLGRVSDEKLQELYAQARGFIMMNKEDFGITPVESMASGTPVFAYNQGGARETVIHNETWFLFNSHQKDALFEALESFDANIEKDIYSIHTLTQHARSFSQEKFRSQLQAIIEKSFEGTSWEKILH